MIIYFADRGFSVLGQASTSIRDGYTITDDTRKEAVDTAVASLDATITYTDSGRLELEAMCKPGNYLLAYDGDREPAQTACYMIVTTEQSVTDRTLTVYAEDSGLDLLNNLSGAYKGNATMKAGDYVKVFLDGTGFELLADNSTASAKACEWTDTETVSKRLLDVCDKFDTELTYGFDVSGMEVTRRWISIADAVGEEKNVNLYIDHEVNDITVKGSVENLATALMATGKDSVNLKGFNVPSADSSRYEIDPDGNLVDKVALEKWHRADGETGNLYQKISDTNITNQADLYNAAKEKLESLSDVVTNYEVDIAVMPDGVGLGDRINIIDDAGELYISGRILELETSVTSGKVKATLGEYIQESSGISDTVTKLAEQFAELSKVRELYTWIVYADNENGDGITTDPTGKAYMGTAANKTTEEPVLNASLYKWSRIKGDQGDPGEEGATGPQGPQGEKGDTGATGPQGPQGEQGVQGETGADGAKGDKGDKGDDGVSPVVTLETKSGSTAIKVKDVEGTKETELIDGTARADASAASDKANLANSTAETAKNTADNAGKLATAAKTTADSASSTASNALESAATANTTATAAKNTADKAQSDINATKQHFYYDERGAHVENGDWRADVKGDGLHIVDADNVRTVAKFTKDGQTLYDRDDNVQTSLNANGLWLGDGGEPIGFIGRLGETHMYDGETCYFTIQNAIGHKGEEDEYFLGTVDTPVDVDESARMEISWAIIKNGEDIVRVYLGPQHVKYKDAGILKDGYPQSYVKLTDEVYNASGKDSDWIKNATVRLILGGLTKRNQDALVVYNREPVDVIDISSKPKSYSRTEFPIAILDRNRIAGVQLDGDVNSGLVKALKVETPFLQSTGMIMAGVIQSTQTAELGGNTFINNLMVEGNTQFVGNITTDIKSTQDITATNVTASKNVKGNVIQADYHVTTRELYTTGHVELQRGAEVNYGLSLYDGALSLNNSDIISGDINYTKIATGTGKMTLTTGTVGTQPQWAMIGNVAQISLHVACNGSVASGSNIAAGKVTGVPKPVIGAGVRGASYYGDNANISYMGADGTFYSRNCGKDALAKGNDARLNAVYLTDGTML